MRAAQGGWVVAGALVVLATYSAFRGGADASTAARPVALIGDEIVSEQTLDKLVGDQLLPHRTREYEIRLETLDALIDARVLDRAAADRQLSVDGYLQRELASRVSPVTDAEVVEQMRRRGASLDDRDDAEAVSAIRDGLLAERRGRALKALVAQLRDEQRVQVLLSPPRAQAATQVNRDSGGAFPSVVLYCDLGSTSCSADVLEARDALQRVAGSGARLSLRDLPNPRASRLEGRRAAIQCAAHQDLAAELAIAVAQQEAEAESLNSALIRRAALDAGVDLDRLDDCMASPDPGREWRDGLTEAADLGIEQGPAVVVNGRLLTGRRLKDLEEVIKEELAQ